MPDAYTQIPLQVKPPPSINDQLAPVSSLLNLQQGVQNLQTGALQQQRTGLQLQQEQQNLNERNAANQIFSNVDDYKGDDGQPDYNTLTKKVMSVAPTVGPGMLGDFIKMHTDAANAHTAITNMKENDRQAAGRFTQSLVGLPPDEVQKRTDLITQVNPQLAPAFQFFNKLVAGAYAGGGQQAADDAIVRIGRSIETPSTQQAMATPGGIPVATGAGGTTVSTKPWTNAPVGAAIPGATYTAMPGPGTPVMTTDAQGRPVPGILGPQQFGAGMTMGGLPGQPMPQQVPPQPPPGVAAGAQPPPAGMPAPGAPPAQAVPSPVAPPVAPSLRIPQVTTAGAIPTGMATGVPEALAGAGDLVKNVRAAGDTAPLTRSQNASILQAIDKTSTGPFSGRWQNIAAALNLPTGIGYQELGKLLKQKALVATQAMGAPSDARLAANYDANGSLDFSPEALRMVTKYTDAMNTALLKYRQGMDNAVGTGLKQDNSKVDAFRSAWTKNYDLDLFRLEDAVRNGDNGEIAKIKQEIAAEDARRAGMPGQISRTQELKQHRAALESLANTGNLPSR